MARLSKNHYVNNKKFLETLIAYKELVAKHKAEDKQKPQIPNYVGECLILIANRLSSKPNFSGYTFKDEMVSDGIEDCLHRDTKILTIEHGPIEIGKIVGTSVTVKSRDGIWRTAAVKSYGRRMLYEYGFGSRNKSIDNITQKVVATDSHRWYLQARLDRKGNFVHGNVEVRDLKIGDMLETVPYLDGINDKAVLHGIIFGDGTGHKGTVYGDPLVDVQGTKYAFMRVCKKDKVKDEIVTRLTNAGYSCTYPPSADGDPVFYIGKFPFVKNVPYTIDPEYISGFIYGWWLADGLKTCLNNEIVISSIDENAINWLVDHCAYAGYHLISIRTTGLDVKGRFPTNNPLYTICIRHDDHFKPRVKYIKEWGEDEVFCLEEPVTHGFVLANGILTGNCIKYLDNFDPLKGTNPFAYFTQFIWNAFIRRIQKEKKQLYIKMKNLEHSYSQEDIENISRDKIRPKMTENYNDYITQWETNKAKK